MVSTIRLLIIWLTVMHEHQPSGQSAASLLISQCVWLTKAPTYRGFCGSSGRQGKNYPCLRRGAVPGLG